MAGNIDDGSILTNSVKENLGKKRIYECKYCDKKYIESKGLKNHLQSIHQAEGKQFACEICSESFYAQIHLTTHIQKKHDFKKSIVEASSCNICEKPFHNKHDLKRHLKIFHGKTTVLKCDNCSAEFKYKSALDNHILQSCSYVFTMEMVYLYFFLLC